MPEASQTNGTAASPLERPGRLRQAIRMGWTTADQVLSSATNAALSFLVAREVSASEFGSFSFAFIAFMYATGILRGLVSEPLIIRFSGSPRAEQRQAIARSAGAALVVGTGLGMVAALVGVVTGGLTGTLLVVLGFLLPGLMLQAHWRLAFFASGRPQAAFITDLIWGVLQIAGVLALIRLGLGDAVAYLTTWGLSASVAAAVGVWQAGVVPRLRAGPGWIREQSDIGLRFTGGFLINQGAFNSSYFVVAAIAGSAAVGAMRGAEVLLGPIRILFSSIYTFALPLASARVSAQRPIRRLALGVSLAASVLSLLFTAFVLVIPTSVGEQLLGDTWTGGRELAGVFGLQYAATGVVLGAALGLAAYAEPAVRVVLVMAPLAVGLGAAGAVWNGAYGAVLGLFIAQAVGAVYGWWVFVRRTRGPAPIPKADSLASAVSPATH